MSIKLRLKLGLFINKQTNMHELFIELTAVIHDRFDSFTALMMRPNDESYTYATIILMTQIFS